MKIFTTEGGRQTLVKINHCQDSAVWDGYVRAHPGAIHFHLYGWKRVIEETYGLRGIYLMALETDLDGSSGTTVRGILPLVYMNLPFSARRLVSLPFLDVGGILAEDAAAEEALITEALAVARQLKADRLELRCARAFDCFGAPGDFERLMTNLNCTYRLLAHKVGLTRSLPSSSGALLDSFNSKLRSQIKKGMKNGLSYETGGERLIDPFYAVFARNMRDLGSPVHARRLFVRVMTHFPESARIAIVRKDHQAVAGSLVLRFRDTVQNPWASSLRRFRSLNSNVLLYWVMLAYGCDHAFRRFDFGRSSRGAGTYRFKLQWGAEPSPLYWHYFFLGGPDPLKERLTFRVWKRLPLPLSKLLGPMVRKRIGL
jgi:serine/alanine adding enzyme